jgi:hypothetical protein
VEGTGVTRTDGGYADLNINYGEPGGGNTSLKYFSVAGTTAINDWAARTRSRYHSLQVALNRPFKQGLMLKGAYTLSRAMNMADEDGWIGLAWNHPLNCPGCGSVLIDVSGDPKPIGNVGSSTETYYDKTLFSQPTGLGKEGFGNSGRNRFRSPPTWNLDLSLFKQFRAGERFKPEFRIEAGNVFNHTNWSGPDTGFTSINFLMFTPSSASSGRRVQLGLRLSF